MVAPLHSGYTESQEKINARWERMKARAEIHALTEKETSRIANCHTCLLAENMKDCPNCKENIGLMFPKFTPDPRNPEQIALDADWQDLKATERDAIR